MNWPILIGTVLICAVLIFTTYVTGFFVGRPALWGPIMRALRMNPARVICGLASKMGLKLGLMTDEQILQCLDLIQHRTPFELVVLEEQYHEKLTGNMLWPKFKNKTTDQPGRARCG